MTGIASFHESRTQIILAGRLPILGRASAARPVARAASV